MKGDIHSFNVMYISMLYTINLQGYEGRIRIGEPPLVDYLPPMYVYEFIMKSKRPDPLATFDTIVYPFDIYIWTFMIISMILQFLMLIAMQKIWSSLSGNFNINKFVFEG